MSNMLKNRYVRAILLSGLFLQIGIWVRNFAILLYVMDHTGGDPFAVSMISVAEYAPIFLFSFLAGTFADRWRPKRTMVWCDVLSALSVIAVLVTFVFGTWKAIFFATLISAVLSQFSQPSGMKLFKLHVPAEQMQAGMSAYQTLFAIFMVLGPILGTFVFQQWGMEVSMLITAVAFLASAGVLYMLPPDRVEEGERQESALLEEMASGIRYVLRSRVLSLLGICFMAAGLGIGMVQPLAIFLVTEQLQLPKESLQWLLMVQGVGMIVGGALTMALAKNVPPQRLLVLGMLGNAVALGVCGVSTHLWLTLLAQLLAGLLLPCIQIGINTMLLKYTESSFIGRVNGILTPLFTGSMVIMMSVAGVLKLHLSLMLVYEIAAILFLIGLSFILPLYRVKEGKPMPSAEQIGS
ncbi:MULTISPECIES: MFS transporter [Brevibacillus]|jgi:Arabinose efflux permease|uniref:MFS transporter n=1 Tax=Brevibacillus TaxID=55080 RepID=UPI000EB9FFB8|nr:MULTISPECIES: MFS transporter [Brevibacillus]MDH6353374.1 MFS family permease [Brevibacillus sp. 1238]MED2253463.1 MFS transporter [Brevibacillus parabrevis]NRQ56412.1 MFS transporter [Brevibacillus sp. HD1.4A]UED69518.1 MFS transporter [Brevibacillus sp. HD3.3A]HBZ82997.1 MFS transporter [Brevibacillus sp.]